MFPETYGRTLEELAFLFEDRALAEEATMNVEKQMQYSERRQSRVEERTSWEMDVVIPNPVRARSREHSRGDSGQRRGEVRDMRSGNWWED